MQSYFHMSSNMGKLYLNYPMIEAFYHMETIPDPSYLKKIVTLAELHSHTYKQRVHMETRKQDYHKFIQNCNDCNIVILQNLQKARWLVDGQEHALCALPDLDWNPDSYLEEVLQIQLQELQQKNDIAVLCTCCLFIWEYNPNLLRE